MVKEECVEGGRERCMRRERISGGGKEEGGEGGEKRGVRRRRRAEGRATGDGREREGKEEEIRLT